MNLETYLIYVVTVLVFFAHPPGPSQLLFMAGAMQHGPRRALPIMAGDLSANAMQIAIAGFGLAGLIAVSAGLFTVVKWLGVAWLVWIGVRTILAARRSNASVPPPPPARLFRQGFVTSSANPYAVVFFAALFPQFIDLTMPVLPQVVILGVTYLILLGVLAARVVRALGSAAERWLGYVSGGALIAAAGALALRGEPQTQ